MRVVLEPELFQPPAQDATLISFFNYALEDRHRVETDLAHPIVVDWLATQSVRIQQDVHFAVDSSAGLEALEPAITRVDIGRFARSDFAADPIRVRLQDAAAFLERPLSLLLEDAGTDRSFLSVMLTPEERRHLEKLEARGYVRVEHGGGLGSMRTRVQERLAEPSTPYRLWVLFDSDALQPGTPSTQSIALKTACNSLPHYQLSRRHIESYITGPALTKWAYMSPRNVRRRRIAAASAFFRMGSAQRHHFNMKAGFMGDAERTDELGNLYDGVPTADRTALANGFGQQIASLFDSGDVTEQDLRRNSGWSELRPVVERLIAFMR